MTTGRAALRYPAGTDPANVPQDIQNLASDIDALLLIWKTGTTAAKPGAAANGRLYYETDGDRISYDMGSAWRKLLMQTADGKYTADAHVNATGYEVAGTALASTHLSDTALLARLASPALTGTPTAPTPTGGDNSTKIATTAFLAAATLLPSKLSGYPADATKVLKGDGSWGVLTKAAGGGSLGTYELSTDVYGPGQGAMLGLGIVVTPTATGKVIVAVDSVTGGNWSNTSADVTWRFGTGTPPANSAAITGTSTGVVQAIHGGADARQFSHRLYLSGLSIGTAYWLDLGMVFTGTQGGQTPGLVGGAFTYEEVG